jgi:toxin secretion/phage lysis holin
LLNFQKIVLAAAASIITAATYGLGGWDSLLYILLSFIILDYITGVLAAIYNKTLSSYTGFKGIIKKVITLCLVWLAVCLDMFITPGSPWIRTLVIYFLVANEGISMLENVVLCGVAVPGFLQGLLIQVKDKANSTATKEEG